MGLSENDVDGVRTALEGAGLTSGSVYVASAANPGFGRRVVILMEVPQEEMTVDLLREVLRRVYESTPEGFTSYIELSVNASGQASEEGLGESISLVRLVRELGLTYVPGGGAYRFQRKDLEPLFG